MVHKPTQLRKKFSFCILVRLAQGRIFGLCVLGGVFPYVHEIRDKGDIQWRKPLRRQRPEGEANFFGQNFSTVHELIGLDSYLQKYDIINTETGARLSHHESFEDWTLLLGDKALLCCPEDGRYRDERHAQQEGLREGLWCCYFLLSGPPLHSAA